MALARPVPVKPGCVDHASIRPGLSPVNQAATFVANVPGSHGKKNPTSAIVQSSKAATIRPEALDWIGVKQTANTAKMRDADLDVLEFITNNCFLAGTRLIDLEHKSPFFASQAHLHNQVKTLPLPQKEPLNASGPQPCHLVHPEACARQSGSESCSGCTRSVISRAGSSIKVEGSTSSAAQLLPSSRSGLAGQSDSNR